MSLVWRVIRGRVVVMRHEELLAAGALRFANGLAFLDGEGALVHELYPDVREKLFEVVGRSPVEELHRALDPSRLKGLIGTLRRFSVDPEPGRFVAAMTWELEGRGTLRLRELARDLEGSERTATSLLLDAAHDVARGLGAGRLALQTHAAFARRLLAEGWREDRRAGSLIVRLGARVVGDRTYVLPVRPGTPR